MLNYEYTIVDVKI